jgi:hypothetical protein
MKKLLLFFAGFLMTAFSAVAQFSVTITVKDLPAYHAENSPVFIAGSFNNWNPADKKFQLEQLPGNGYSITLQLAAGNYEYKFTRGGWDKAECKQNGIAVENRQLNVQSDTAYM